VLNCTANYRPVLSSELAPYMKKKVIVIQRNLKSGHLPQMELDTKTNWRTDSRLQYNLNLNYELELEQ
jgi:hypothetical protein